MPLSIRGRKQSLLKLEYLSKNNVSWRIVSVSSKDEPGMTKL